MVDCVRVYLCLCSHTNCSKVMRQTVCMCRNRDNLEMVILETIKEKGFI